MIRPPHYYLGTRLYLEKGERKLDVYINLNDELNPHVASVYRFLNTVLETVKFRPIVNDKPKKTKIGDGVCSVHWNEELASLPAAAWAPSRSMGNRTYEFDVEFDPSLNWQVGKPIDRNVKSWDLVAVMAHEVCHSLGLGHPDEIGLSFLSVVNSRLQNGERWFTDQDLDALRWIYNVHRNEAKLVQLRKRKYRIMDRPKSPKRDRQLARVTSLIAEELSKPSRSHDGCCLEN